MCLRELEGEHQYLQNKINLKIQTFIKLVLLDCFSVAI